MTKQISIFLDEGDRIAASVLERDGVAYTNCVYVNAGSDDITLHVHPRNAAAVLRFAEALQASALKYLPRTMVLRRVCSWCDRVLAEGDPGAATTHAICDACAEKVRADENGAAA